MGADTTPRVPPTPAGEDGAPRGTDSGAWASVWRAAWASRLLVWTAGLGGLWLLGRAAGWRGFDGGGLTDPFGSVGDLVVAPAARWDSAWYLAIAQDGYAPQPERAAFFPLYPLLIRLLSAPATTLGAPPAAAHLVAGIAISVAAMLSGLWLVHRLTSLELGPRQAGLAVTLVAFFPTALYLSAVYSESLFLALSAGSLYLARRGRWGWAATAAAAAGATRSTGVLLLIPLALLYLYGPREDRDEDGPVEDRSDGSGAGGRLRPRHRLGPEVAWLALVPAGLVAYLLYLGVTAGDSLAPFAAGKLWYREFAGPVGGVWDGAVAAVAGIRQLASGAREPVFFPQAGGDPMFVAVHNVGNFAFLVFAAVAVVGAMRRLPAAYGAWALAAIAVPLSYPVAPEPLASFPRYVAVVFPLHMWLAAWACERRRRAWSAVLVSVAALGVLSAGFTAWRWVA